MAASIIQTEKCCFVSGSVINLDKHPCIHGRANRELAEKYGLWVWLRHDIHMSLHDRDKDLDRYLEQVAQEEFEKTHSREEYRRIFGKSYL